MATIVSCGRKFDKYVNLKVETKKLQNFTTIDGINKENNDLSSAIIGDDITTKFKAITEWGKTGTSTPLTSRWKNSVSIKSVVIKAPYNNVDNTLEVTIALQDANSKAFNYTKDITITFGGWSLKTEINKIQHFITIDGINKENNDLFSVVIGEDITTKFTKITEWGTTGNPAPLINNFRQGVSIESVVVKTPYSIYSKSLQVTITLSDSNNLNKFVNNTKDITVTFVGQLNLKTEIYKLQSFIIDDSVNEQDNDLSSVAIGDNITIQFKKITRWGTTGATAPLTNSFRPGISIASVIVKTPYNNSDNTLEVMITLQDANNTNIFNNTKDITITFDGWSLKTEIDKLQSFTTDDSANKQDNDLSSAIIGDDITTKFKAITEWGKIGTSASLINRWKNSVSIKSVIVKTPYNNLDNTLEVTITLQDAIIKKNIFNNTKDIIITFDSLIKNLIDEIAKLQDFSTIYSANVQNPVHIPHPRYLYAKLVGSLSLFVKGNNVTSQFNAILIPKPELSTHLTSSFSKGISIKSVVVKEIYDSLNKTLKVTITLQDANNKNVSNNTKDITITFERENLSLEIAKLQNFATTDTVNKVNNDLSSFVKDNDITTQFKAITGQGTTGKSAFLTNSLGRGVSIESVVVKEGYNFVAQTLKVIITLKYKFIIYQLIPPNVIIKPSLINNTKEITITFEHWTLKEEIDKLQDFSTIDSVNKQNLFSAIIGTNIKTRFRAITEWRTTGAFAPLKNSFRQGVSIASVVVKESYNSVTKKLKATITLEDENIPNVSNNIKDITITFGLSNLKNEIKKFPNIMHIANTLEQFNNSNLSSAAIGDNITIQFYKFIGWEAQPHPSRALSTHITISSVVVKEVYNSTTRTLKVTITLKDNNNLNVINNKKDIIMGFYNYL